MLDIQSLSFKYTTDWILKDVNLQVKPNEVVALLGPNGIGKTTLLDCIIGYKTFDSGQVAIMGKNQNEYKADERAKIIAYVPQASDEVLPFTVSEIVLMGRMPYLGRMNAPSKKDEDIAFSALKTLGIEKYADRLFSQLSGGEKQLVLIAKSLAQDTKIILMDEPTASLDIKNEMMVLNCIKDLVTDTDKSVIFATHQVNHAFFFHNIGLSVKAAMMMDKRVIYYGSPDEVLNEKYISEVYGIDCRVVEYDGSEKIVTAK